MRKKRVLIHSNFCKMFTGFGKHKKNLLLYLYKTGKYEIIELSNGFRWSEESIKSVPWESYGSLPDDNDVLAAIQNDQIRAASASYGSEMIDEAVYRFKPDIYLGIEDIWAFNGFYEKPWWNKINSIVHTTLDSLPILPDAIRNAPKVKNYFVWSSFAQRELNKLGHNHVKTVRGIVDTKSFYKLTDYERNQLRKHFKLDNSFVIGFVFRNQLRKSVPNLLEGFKLFTEKNPKANARLLLHTHWTEGWDIPRLLDEKQINPHTVVTTYFCKACSNYFVQPFVGQNLACPYCKSANSCETTNIKHGVDEKQLNQIYNLMDVYCHPFTSGGQEIPIQEAKLTELITLVTNYSCGEDCCTEESGGLPLEWSEYREPGTQFIKASTSSEDICKKLQYVFELNAPIKKIMGAKARQFVINNYSVEVVGKFFEELFDSLPYSDFNFVREQKLINSYYIPNNSLNDEEWIKSLYENMLGRIDSDGVVHWCHRLRTDLNRDAVLEFFKKTSLSASQELRLNRDLEQIKLDNAKKIAIVQPEAEEEVIACSAILKSLKECYPQHKIYFITKPQYIDLIDSNKYIEKVLLFHPKFSDPLFLEGKADGIKYFDIVYCPFLSMNKNNFFRNGAENIAFNIYESN